MSAADERRSADRPLLGVGAVLLSPRLDEVLLVQRRRAPAAGLWSVPGGLLERGESLQEACAREVLEETGLVAELRGVAKVLERIIENGAGAVEYHYVIVDFWGRATGGALQAASDARQAQWVRRDAIAARPTTLGLLEVIERAVQLARGELPDAPLFEVLRS